MSWICKENISFFLWPRTLDSCFGNQLGLPGNKLLKGPEALTTGKTRAAREAGRAGVPAQPQPAPRLPGLVWLAQHAGRHCTAEHSLNATGPHMVFAVPGTTSFTGSLRCQVLNSSPGDGGLNKAALVWEKTKEEGPFLSIPQPVLEALAKPSPTGTSPTASRLYSGI